MSDNSKLSAASWLVGPSRHAGIGKAVKWGHVHIVFPLDSWIFVSVSVGLFQDPGQNSFLVTRIIGKFWYLIHRLLEHLYFWFLTYPWFNYPQPLTLPLPWRAALLAPWSSPCLGLQFPLISGSLPTGSSQGTTLCPDSRCPASPETQCSFLLVASLVYLLQYLISSQLLPNKKIENSQRQF